MKKRLLIVLFAVFVPCAMMASVGNDTEAVIDGPDCLTGGDEALIEVAITFHSPDGETMRFVDIAFPDSWQLGQIFNPPAQSIAGNWNSQPYPGQNGVQWVFARTAGPGGGLADGETAVFSFYATPVNPNERTIQVYLEGDVATPTPPHSAEFTLTYDLCGGDDDTDDDTSDDDDWHTDDDTSDDDTGDDDTDDDSGDDACTTLLDTVYGECDLAIWYGGADMTDTAAADQCDESDTTWQCLFACRENVSVCADLADCALDLCGVTMHEAGSSSDDDDDSGDSSGCGC